MAQGERPVRHSRHPSRITTSGSDTGAEGGKKRDVLTSNPNNAATIIFIKRVLCSKPTKSGPLTDTTGDEISERPLDELLPPLTSSNEIDVQLYAIISVILNRLVQSWYNRITPDGDFVGEIVQIIAHCTRGLEERLRHVDLESLVLNEVPDVLLAHLDAITVARETIRARRIINVQNHIRSIYHALRPHNALTPAPVDEATAFVQDENEVDWSQLLVSGIMPFVLPPEDMVNPCLDVLVSEIFSEMIVHRAILGKACEPWLIWEGVTKAIHALRPKSRMPEDSSLSPTSRLEQFGLLTSAESTRRDSQGTHSGTFDAISLAFWSTLQLAALAWVLARAFVTALMQTSSIQPRARRASKASDKVHTAAEDSADGPASVTTAEGCPIVSMRIWPCLEQLTSLQQRMPWLTGCLSILQWLSLHGVGQVCRTNSALDRLMSAQVHEKLLNPVLLPPILQAIRSAVFPDNALAPARVPPTSDEVVEIKHACARAIVEAIPEPVRLRYFVTKDKEIMEKDVEDKLELFGDAYINKHLIVALVELLVVRLFPELSEPVYIA